MGNLNLAALLSGVAVGGPLAAGITQAGGIQQQAGAEAAAARANARLAQREGAQQASSIRREGRRELGRQRTVAGASGVQLEGSPLDLLVSNAAEIEREAVQAEIAARNTARLDRSRASSIERAGKRQGASAILGGAIGSGSVASQLFLRRG